MLKTSVGGWDKRLRIVIGAAPVVLGAFGPIGWWGLIGSIPLLTGLAGSCPLYTLFGMNTCPRVTT
jgi:hypothetical protein